MTSATTRWTDDLNRFRASSMGEVWTILSAISSAMPETRLLFRGVANEDWDVSTALERQLAIAGRVTPEESDALRTEEALLTSVREWRLGNTAYGHIPDLHLMAIMQHHGIPTRLLDVTRNPLTALWFACAEPQPTTSRSALLVFCTNWLPIHQTLGDAYDLNTWNGVPPWRSIMEVHHGGRLESTGSLYRRTVDKRCSDGRARGALHLQLSASSR